MELVVTRIIETIITEADGEEAKRFKTMLENQSGKVLSLAEEDKPSFNLGDKMSLMVTEKQTKLE